MKRSVLSAASRALYAARNWKTTNVHGGLHKTGSSSLQASLGAVGLLQASSREDFRDGAELRRVLLDATLTKRVVSSEHLFGELHDFYSTACERFDFLKTNLDRSRTTFYLRPHPDWYSSTYSQFLQEGRVIDLASFERAALSSPYFSWNSLASDLLDLSDQSAQVLIRVANDVVHDYSQVIGVALPRIQPKNASLSPMALEALIRLTQEGFVSSAVARSALRDFMPESKRSTSIFSEQFQLQLLGRQEDWLEFSKTMLSVGQPVSERWVRNYSHNPRPTARDIFTTEHLHAARRLVVSKAAKDVRW